MSDLQKWREESLEYLLTYCVDNDFTLQQLRCNRTELWIDDYVNSNACVDRVQAFIAGRAKAHEEIIGLKVDSFFEEDWDLSLDEMSIEDLRSQILLMYTWVKQHQYATNNANRIKNQEIKKRNEALVMAKEILEGFKIWSITRGPVDKALEKIGEVLQ